MEKRLILKPVPRVTEEAQTSEGPVQYEKIDLGVGSRPRFVVVLRGKNSKKSIHSVLNIGTKDNNLGGSPVVWLPEGADLEIYEVEP